MVKNSTVDFSFWLRFSHTGSLPNISKNVPALAADERAMQCHVALPLALFARPQLQVRIKVEDLPPLPPLTFDVQAAESALRSVLGAEVRFDIIPPAQGEGQADG